MAKQYRFRFKNLDVYQAAVEHFAWAVEAVGRMPDAPYKVKNQVLGASLSIMGNIGEANGREKEPREIEQHYRYSQGSAFESATHLDALCALGVVQDEEYYAEEERLARISAMLTRLMQSQRRRRARGARRKGGSEGASTGDARPEPAAEKRGPKARRVEQPYHGVEKGGRRTPVEERAPQAPASNSD